MDETNITGESSCLFLEGCFDPGGKGGLKLLLQWITGSQPPPTRTADSSPFFFSFFFSKPVKH